MGMFDNPMFADLQRRAGGEAASHTSKGVGNAVQSLFNQRTGGGGLFGNMFTNMNWAPVKGQYGISPENRRLVEENMRALQQQDRIAQRGYTDANADAQPLVAALRAESSGQ